MSRIETLGRCDFLKIQYYSSKFNYFQDMYTKCYIIFGSITIVFSEQYISRDQDTWSCVRGQVSCVSHKCEPLTCHFQPLISLQPLGRFLSIAHILYPPYTRPYIPNLKEICWEVCEICVPENCPIFFTFFFFFAPFYISNCEPSKNTLLVDWFLSNLAHL